MKKYFLWSVLLVFALMLGNTSAFSQVITDKEKVVEKTVEAQIAVEPALLLLFNRPILLLRATVFKQTPEERVKFITQRFNEIVTQGNVEKVVAMRIKEGIAIGLDENPIMVITEDDIDPFSKRNLDQTVEVVVKRLENVLFLINEQKSLRYNLKAAGLCIIAFAMFILLIKLLTYIRRRLRPKIERAENSFRDKIRELGLKGTSLNLHILSLLEKLVFWVLVSFASYALLTFSLKQFPYTEPWGRRLGGYIVDAFGGMTEKTLDSIPNLFVILVIFLIAQWLVRISKTFFTEVENQVVTISWLDSDAARPTMKIMNGVIWIFAIVMAYPYIPGSSTDAFKGIGMFLGLLISLGASSMVGQVIGGMVLMYSRAMKVGDIVQIGEYYGKVLEIGFFATKLRTLKNEEINIPNSLMMGSTTKNFTRISKNEGLIAHSSVTIGYDVPWRQVHAMLINAAEKTEGIQKKPAPFVLQKDLKDFYVEYEINAYVEKPEGIMKIMSELHSNIQDEFNRHGVQIMSPNYEDQPDKKVWVPEEKWYEAPAKK